MITDADRQRGGEELRDLAQCPSIRGAYTPSAVFILAKRSVVFVTLLADNSAIK